ncbi:hypothetical protein [Polaribacter glomeratus]|nr:hypothetical protein [Polaribacter glomeratus]
MPLAIPTISKKTENNTKKDQNIRFSNTAIPSAITQNSNTAILEYPINGI